MFVINLSNKFKAISFNSTSLAIQMLIIDWWFLRLYCRFTEWCRFA